MGVKRKKQFCQNFWDLGVMKTSVGRRPLEKLSLVDVDN